MVQERQSSDRDLIGEVCTKEIMRTDVIVDASRSLSAPTQTEQRTLFRGATGAVIVFLTRDDVRLWASGSSGCSVSTAKPCLSCRPWT